MFLTIHVRAGEVREVFTTVSVEKAKARAEEIAKHMEYSEKVANKLWWYDHQLSDYHVSVFDTREQHTVNYDD
jgi:hypothetical protein